MNVRTIAWLALALTAHAVVAAAQPAAPPDQESNETRFGAELRLQREHIAEDCGALKKVASCAATLVTGHPFHVSFGSIAPMNGFGAGPAVVTHFTPRNW